MLLSVSGVPNSDADSFWQGALAPKKAVVVTSLPLPVCHVGFAFLAYADDPNAAAFLCECSRRAVGNYVNSSLAEKRERRRMGGPMPQGRYDCVIDGFFPRVLGEEFWGRGIKNEDVLGNLRFIPNVCHRCCRAVPPYENIEAASYFERVFRRILYRDLYDMGFDFIGHPLPHLSTEFHTHLLPDDFTEIMERHKKMSEIYYGQPAPAMNAPAGTWRDRHLLHQEVARSHREVQRIRKSVCDHAAEKLREHYQFPRFKKWLQRETVLFLNLRSIFRSQEVIRHAKPAFLGGLELDIWIPNERLGVEFQGAQHLQPMEHFGGDVAFQKVQERDARKMKLCQRNGVRLVYFFETDDLNEASVLQRLNAESG